MNLQQIYNQIPKSKCQPGCGKCCGIIFPSLKEIKNVKDWCTSRNIQFKEFTMKLDENCPYLKEDKTCQIYPVRPFLCRILGVSEDKRLQCENCKPEKILNRIESSYLFKQIYGTRKEKGREAKHQRDLEKIFEGNL